jgi:hypothetical protein
MEKYYTYNYDDMQRLIEEDWYSAKGDLEYKIEYKYYNNGDKKSATTFNQRDVMLYRYEYKYGAKGNVLEEEKYNEDDKSVGIIQYVYKYFQK